MIVNNSDVRYRCKLAIVLAASILFASELYGGLPAAKPEVVGMRSERLAGIESLVQKAIADKRFPGCVIAVGRHGKLVYHRAFGHRRLQPEKWPMETDTVFDMASITKPVATATSVMMLVEQGKLRVRDKVSTYIPEFANSGKKNVTLFQAMTHQAGFIPDNSIKDYKLGRKVAFENIYKLDTKYDPGTSFVYSDVGFILLDDLIERASGQTVAEFSKQNIFEPLGMTETGYLPSDALRSRAATTEKREDRWMQGEVHDPRAYLMDGVAGHAGLFSTADDIAVYAQMMLNGGYYNGKRILSKATVEMMTREYKIVEGKKVSIRGLGWDKLTGYSSNRAENMSSRAYGHGGFTGTVLWIDPELDLFFIMLSNRVHPNGKGYVNRVAGQIATLAVASIDDELLGDGGQQKESKVVASRVKTGIDRLREDGFESLKGQRLGLITNQTGVAADGTPTINLLNDADNANLVALFSPEHGLAGKLDQSLIADDVNSDTGLKVFSLYGKTRKPTATQLSNVDTLIFDIQDIGCRYYTYISTMGLAMQAAEEAGKRFVVLDRPNPIGGVKIGGPMLDTGKESFVGFHRLPIQHAMTIGELAKMFKEEMGLSDLQLDVVPCSGWQRSQYFDQTGLTWINPSPNMRNLNEAILYPAIGVWETTNLSVGRGTDTPFEIVGAPWISSNEFASALNASEIRGIRFTPRDFTPDASKFAGEQCGGVQISITNREGVDTAQLGFTFASVLWKLYEDQWQIGKSMRLLASQSTLDAIKSNQSIDGLLTRMRDDQREFVERRSAFLLYD